MHCCRISPIAWKLQVNAVIKDPVILATFPCNLSRNIVALQVTKLCCPYYHPASNKFQCCKLQQHVARSRTRFYYWQQILMLLTGVVIRATKLCNLHTQCCASSCKEMLPVLPDLNDTLSVEFQLEIREFTKPQRRRGQRPLKNGFLFYLRISQYSEVIYFVQHCRNDRETESGSRR